MVRKEQPRMKKPEGYIPDDLDRAAEMQQEREQQQESQFNGLDMAMFNSSFPVNPCPFAIGIYEGVKRYGTDWIKTDEARRILYILIAQSYGQGFNVDSFREFNKLNRTKGGKNNG